LSAWVKTTAVTAKPTQPNQPSLPACFDAPSSRPGSNLLPPPTTWASVLGSSSTSTKIQEGSKWLFPMHQLKKMLWHLHQWQFRRRTHHWSRSL
jgi:hypothetical protein